ERRQVVLQRGAGGVLAARVVVAVLEPGGVLLHVGRGAVDRRHDGAGARIGALAGVDGKGAEAHGTLRSREQGPARIGVLRRPLNAKRWKRPPRRGEIPGDDASETEASVA